MLSPVENLVNDWQFMEIWIDPTTIPPYVLMLLGDSEDNFYIFDPTQKYKIIFASSAYEEAKQWLLEDEYERVEGRLTLESVI